MGEKWDKLQSEQFKGGREAWQDGLPDDHIAQRMTKMPRYHAGLEMGEWHRQWAENVLRVLKPGGHVLAFSGSRTSHWLGYGLELAGFEIRDQIQWLTACLSEDTEILVNGRWMKWNEVKIGQRALCYDIKRRQYSWEWIQDHIVYQHNDTAFSICSELTDQLVSRNHRCLIERDGILHFETAESLAWQCQIRIPILEDLQNMPLCLPCAEPLPTKTESSLLTPVCCQERTDESADMALRSSEYDRAYMSNLRGSFQTASLLGEEMQTTLLLSQMQRNRTGKNTRKTCLQRTKELDRGESSRLSKEDVWILEPSVDGGDCLPNRGLELQGRDYGSLPVCIPEDGRDYWIYPRTSIDRGKSHRTVAYERRSCTSREPQSAGQSTREPCSVFEQHSSQASRSRTAYRTTMAWIKPSHYRGIMWCITVPTGAFVARRNGKIFVTGNSGWPKGLNVSKAIDQSLGKEPIKVGVRYEHQPIGGEYGGVYGAREGVVTDTKPATPEAAQWEGWNTALKPAAEPIFVARKPLERTIAENILKWGVGGLNIQACRIACGTRRVGITAGPGKPTVTTFGDGINSRPMVWTEDDLGRWPANVILDEERAKELDQQSGVSTSRRGGMGVGLTDSPVYGSADPDFKSTRGHDDEGGASRFFQIIDTKAGRYPANVIMDEKAAEELDKQSGVSESQRSVRGGFRDGGSMFDTKQNRPIYECGYEDEGGGSRFFYVPKASREEREMGLEKLVPEKTTWNENFGAFQNDTGRRPIRNPHPTVKPIKLMQYLVRLVTPKGGLVLDPFLGSGTTLIACRLEGMAGIGIEKNPEYEAIIKGRISALPPAIEGFDSEAFSAPVPSSTSPVQVLPIEPVIARKVARQITLEDL